ncbi:MAG TPA: hypothetical protein VIK89_06175 [Cytophagaceae bacterium]
MKFILSLISLIVFTTSGFCCSCYNDIEEMNIARYNDHAAIFIGTVDSVSTCNTTYTVYFTIDKTYKGNLPKSLAINDINCESQCALNFTATNQYLVYASHSTDASRLEITPCSGTRKILTDQELEVLHSNSLKFNNANYLEKEIKRWKHEIEMLEKITSKASGYIKTHYMNGKITGEGRLINGIPEGEWTYFYPDGNIKSKGSYVQGKREGNWIEYAIYYNTFEGDAISENNRKKFLIKSTGKYLHGQKDGNWERTNIDGTTHILVYQNGKFIREKLSGH